MYAQTMRARSHGLSFDVPTFDPRHTPTIVKMSRGLVPIRAKGKTAEIHSSYEVEYDSQCVDSEERVQVCPPKCAIRGTSRPIPQRYTFIMRAR